jgi:glycosyltransferase involved in cell wall biosynthesis
MKLYPLVSIISTVYNDSPNVLDTLNCISKQNYPNIQHIIVDDCSEISHFEIVNNWLAKSEYKAELYRNNCNLGLVGNLNFALSLVRGKYLCFNSNDLWDEGKLLTQVEILEKNEDKALVYARTRKLVANSPGLEVLEVFPEHIQTSIMPYAVFEFPFYLQSAMIRWDCMKKLKFQFNTQFISEDWYLILEILLNFKVVGQEDVNSTYFIREVSIFQENWSNEKLPLTIGSNLNMFIYLYKKYRSHRNAEDLLLSINNFFTWLVSVNSVSKFQLLNFATRILLLKWNKGFLIKWISILCVGDLRIFNFIVSRSKIE